MSTNVASVASHFPDAENGFTTTTAGSVSSGAATVTLNSVAGYTNGLPVVLVIDPTDASKKQTFTGIVDTSGVQITSVVWTAGTNQTHALGATVVDYATATHIAMISKGITVQHKQDGTHANTITTDTINENTSANGVTIDGVKLKDNALATNNSVVSTNITADAVTDAKLIYGKLRSRQGGSATDWNTVGTTTFDYSGTDTFVQMGAIFNNASPKTITFPTAFTNKPLVMVVVASVNTTSCFAIPLSITTTTFNCQVYDNAGSTNNSQDIFWIAWGQ